MYVRHRMYSIHVSGHLLYDFLSTSPNHCLCQSIMLNVIQTEMSLARNAMHNFTKQCRKLKESLMDHPHTHMWSLVNVDRWHNVWTSKSLDQPEKIVWSDERWYIIVYPQPQSLTKVNH